MTWGQHGWHGKFGDNIGGLEKTCRSWGRHRETWEAGGWHRTTWEPWGWHRRLGDDMGMVGMTQGWYVIPNVIPVSSSQILWDFMRLHPKQEGIPVGCVPPACWPYPQHALWLGVYLPGGCTCLGGTCSGAVPARGVYLPGRYLLMYSPLPPWEQNDWQTGVKT